MTLRQWSAGLILALIVTVLGLTLSAINARADECKSAAEFAQITDNAGMDVYILQGEKLSVFMAKVNDTRDKNGLPAMDVDKMTVAIHGVAAAFIYSKNDCMVSKSPIIVPLDALLEALSELGISKSDFVPLGDA